MGMDDAVLKEQLAPVAPACRLCASQGIRQQYELGMYPHPQGLEPVVVCHDLAAADTVSAKAKWNNRCDGVGPSLTDSPVYNKI